MSTKSNKFGSGLLNAFASHNENVEIPKKYLLALLLCQEFEFRLKVILRFSIEVVRSKTSNTDINYDPEIPEYWNVNNYIKKIKEFFPQKEHKLFYEKIEAARIKRNKFIHDSFKTKEGDIQFINPDMDRFYLHEQSQNITDEWINSYIAAAKEISKLTAGKFKGLKLGKI